MDFQKFGKKFVDSFESQRQPIARERLEAVDLTKTPNSCELYALHDVTFRYFLLRKKLFKNSTQKTCFPAIFLIQFIQNPINAEMISVKSQNENFIQISEICFQMRF